MDPISSEPTPTRCAPITGWFHGEDDYEDKTKKKKKKTTRGNERGRPRSVWEFGPGADPAGGAALRGGRDD